MMVVYDTIEDIPYNILAQGGTFEVRNVLSEMNRVGYGMGAKGVEALALAPGSLPRPLGPGELPDPNVHWIITILIAHSGMIIGMIAVAVICTFITPLIFTIKAVPEGKIIAETPDGLVLQAADGSTWFLGYDNTTKQLGGPPPSVEGILTAIAVVVIVGVIAYLVITFTRKPAAKKVVKKAAPEPG